MTAVSSELVRAFANRHALLWVCQRHDLLNGQNVHDYELPASAAAIRYRKEPNNIDEKLAELFWEAVWLEGARSPLLDAFRNWHKQGRGKRAPIVLASQSDIEAKVPTEEFLPIRILPGVIESGSPLDAQFGNVRGRVRERLAWEFASQLQFFRGRVLIVIGAREQSDLLRLFQVLEDAPGINLTVLVVLPDGLKLEKPSIPNARIDIWQGSDSDFLARLSAAGAPLSSQSPTWNIRVGSKVIALDPKDAKHVLDKFELLTESKILPANEFSMDDLQEFLRGDSGSWRAYGAGLPVPRSFRSNDDRTLEEEVELLAKKLTRAEDDVLAITVQLPVEGGAGATTLIRSAAYRMASDGVPTIVFRPDQIDVELDQILAFSDALSDLIAAEKIDQHPPLLLVADVEHYAISTLKQVPQLLAARGRKVLFLQAIPITSVSDGEGEKRTKRFVRLSSLKSETDESEVLACQETFSALASKWNLPLQPKTTGDWQRYQTTSRWRSAGGDANVASLFWVALRFFLIEGLSDDQRDNLERNLGAWIDRRTESIKDEGMKRLLDFTAVLSSFRISAPVWTVLRPITGGSFSSTISESLR